ncbi:hypothetical protein [Streptomyces cacaoi]|uniref:Phage tail protein n=1 Tax=Streptomyces cacaoi TaxID=1898 RepID=A0A4Y3QYB7_STRCI|nr:hypothetical protein [Streptomyces cacaoi]GEB50446.1 hypothetical protein SCA03_29970 [Streptomyces cacaoi]
MAHDVIVPGTGYVYVAEASTPAPAFPFAPAEAPDGWTSIGNTSIENGIEMSVDGDDPETLGSWQDPNITSTNPSKTYSLTINLEDITVETLQLYYGATKDAVDKDGNFTIPAQPTPVEKAMFIIASDGSNVVGWYYPRTSIVGSDSITLDPTAITEVPVKATILSGVISGRTSLGKVFPKAPLSEIPPPPSE